MDPTLIISGIRALIRLAAPLATQDALTRRLMVIQGQVGSRRKLPSAMAQRKKEMTDRLEADGVATDCRTIPATQSFDAT